MLLAKLVICTYKFSPVISVRNIQHRKCHFRLSHSFFLLLSVLIFYSHLLSPLVPGVADPSPRTWGSRPRILSISRQPPPPYLCYRTYPPIPVVSDSSPHTGGIRIIPPYLWYQTNPPIPVVSDQSPVPGVTGQ